MVLRPDKLNFEQAIQHMWAHADKPERMRTFHQIVVEYEPDDAEKFWTEFWSIWSSSENLNDDHYFLSTLITKGLAIGDGNPFVGLDDEEREALEKMDDHIEIYRGGSEHNIDGWSWSTDIEKARFFANRYAGEGTRVLARATVAKEDIIGYLTGRSESEVVVDPADLEIDIFEEWEVDEPNKTSLFYAIQSGRMNFQNDEFDQMRISQIVDQNMDDLDDLREEIDGIYNFCSWANLKNASFYKKLLNEISVRQIALAE